MPILFLPFFFLKFTFTKEVTGNAISKKDDNKYYVHTKIDPKILPKFIYLVGTSKDTNNYQCVKTLDPRNPGTDLIFYPDNSCDIQLPEKTKMKEYGYSIFAIKVTTQNEEYFGPTFYLNNDSWVSDKNSCGNFISSVMGEAWVKYAITGLLAILMAGSLFLFIKWYKANY